MTVGTHFVHQGKGETLFMTTGTIFKGPNSHALSSLSCKVTARSRLMKPSRSDCLPLKTLVTWVHKRLLFRESCQEISTAFMSFRLQERAKYIMLTVHGDFAFVNT